MQKRSSIGAAVERKDVHQHQGEQGDEFWRQFLKQRLPARRARELDGAGFDRDRPAILFLEAKGRPRALQPPNRQKAAKRARHNAAKRSATGRRLGHLRRHLAAAAATFTSADAHLLHNSWLSYVHSVLAPHASHLSSRRAAANVATLEMKGARALVERARNACLRGLAGIVVQETRNTWTLFTERERLVVVPKAATVLSVTVGAGCAAGANADAAAEAAKLHGASPAYKIHFFGDALAQRQTDRLRLKRCVPPRLLAATSFQHYALSDLPLLPIS